MVLHLFDTLHALCNLLVVAPDNLKQVCSGEQLASLDKNILHSFVQLRADYRSARLARHFSWVKLQRKCVLFRKTSNDRKHRRFLVTQPIFYRKKMTGRKQQPYLPRSFIWNLDTTSYICFSSFPHYIEFHTLIYKFQISINLYVTVRILKSVGVRSWMKFHQCSGPWSWTYSIWKSYHPVCIKIGEVQ